MNPPAPSRTPAPATAALATAPARGGIAVIILAGDGVKEVLAKVFRPRKNAARSALADRLSLGWIVRGQQVIDEAIVAYQPKSHLAEISIHGGPQVARKVLTALAECGVRILPDTGPDPALAAAARACPHDNPAIAREMLLALRQAAAPLAASAVTAQWSGGLTALAKQALAGVAGPSALRAAAEALPLMKRLLTRPEVVIAGPPNVGKSALANALAGRKVCIVSHTPGTTRDWVRTPADADGVGMYLTDTAGLWAAGDELQAEAVRRAWGRIEAADLVICLTTPEAAGGDDGLLDRLRRLPAVINVSGKCDVLAADPAADLAVSGQTSAGVAQLRRAIRRRLGFADFEPAAAMAFTDRQAALLLAVADALDRGDARTPRDALEKLLKGNQNGS